MNSKTTHRFIIFSFVGLYVITSLVSTIHVIDFFSLSNPHWLAVSLAIAFEVGAAASLASIITLNKMHRGMVWTLFILLTLMQAMGNAYYAYSHLSNFQSWVELFGLVDEEPIFQKRVLAIVSGAILPIVALGFIKALVDYIKPAEDHIEKPSSSTEVNQTRKVEETVTVAKKTIKPISTVLEKKTDEPKVDNINTQSISSDDAIARGLR